MAKGDRDILKADIDDGYTRVANLLLEALTMARLTGLEIRAVLHLIRQTYGWQTSEQEIHLDEWAAALNTTTDRASKTLTALENKSIILRTFIGPGKSYIYSPNTHIDQWDLSWSLRRLEI